MSWIDESTGEATCRNFRQVCTVGARQVERETPFNDRDPILSFGYRGNADAAPTEVEQRYRETVERMQCTIESKQP